MALHILSCLPTALTSSWTLTTLLPSSCLDFCLEKNLLCLLPALPPTCYHISFYPLGVAIMSLRLLGEAWAVTIDTYWPFLCPSMLTKEKIFVLTVKCISWSPFMDTHPTPLFIPCSWYCFFTKDMLGRTVDCMGAGLRFICLPVPNLHLGSSITQLFLNCSALKLTPKIEFTMGKCIF